MKLKHLWKAAGLVALSAILILTLCLAGLLALVLRSAQITQFWNAPLTKLSQSLVLEEGRYHFTGEDLLAQQDLWLMLVGRDGQVLWQYNKPAEVPDQYDLLDVAAFTRWYLEDYPVQTRIRPDGLLVAGAPKGSTWKLTISLSEQILHLLPVWGVLLFFLSLICVLALAALLLRRWFRQDQQARDEARSDWINGISHDIRTPLSMVMGYAGQLEADSALPPARRDQAAIIRRQSQTIRDLVNDLNLPMRLDCQMQALRKTKLDLAPFLRQTAADFLNSGLAEGFSLALDLPDQLDAKATLDLHWTALETQPEALSDSPVGLFDLSEDELTALEKSIGAQIARLLYGEDMTTGETDAVLTGTWKMQVDLTPNLLDALNDALGLDLQMDDPTVMTMLVTFGEDGSYHMDYDAKALREELNALEDALCEKYPVQEALLKQAFAGLQLDVDGSSGTYTASNGILYLTQSGEDWEDILYYSVEDNKLYLTPPQDEESGDWGGMFGSEYPMVFERVD